MKNLLLSLSIIAALFTSCKKESADEAMPSADGSTSSNKAIAGVTSVPATFTKKALIESFTGASYRCPETDALVQNMITNNPGRVIAAGIHEGDKMQIPYVQTLHSAFNNGSMPSVPSFMVDRVPVAGKVFLTNQQLSGFTNKAFNTSAKCGLAINSTIAGRVVNIAVHAGFNQVLAGNYNLAVYIIENNVSQTGKGYDQANIYNTNPSSAFYNLGDPIVGYVHQNVLRIAVTPGQGNPISPANLVPFGQEIQYFQVDLPTTINVGNAYVVAFVDKAGATPTTHEVLNTQIAKLGTLRNWD